MCPKELRTNSLKACIFYRRFGSEGSIVAQPLLGLKLQNRHFFFFSFFFKFNMLLLCVFWSASSEHQYLSLRPVRMQLSVLSIWKVSRQEFGVCSFHPEASVVLAVLGLAAQGKGKDKSCQLPPISWI